MLSSSLDHCRRSFFLSPVVRHLVTTTCLRADERSAFEMERMGRYMKKLMHKQSQRELIHAKGVVVSEGAPNFLSLNKGHQRTITRRQKMLNYHFMEGITDILATEDIGKVVREEEVRITHVEIGQHYNILNIFWTTDKANVTEVAARLKAITGALNKKMVEKNFMTVIPDIRFVYDRNKMSVESVDVLLKKSGLKPAYNPKNFAPPTEIATGYQFRDPLGPRIRAKRVALFFEEFKKSQETAYADEINYRNQRFVFPPDMRLDAQGLDYERLMNQVLAHMIRSRSEQCRHNVYVADPLPPAVWIEDHKLPPDHEKMREQKPDTTIRLSTMRSFIVEHRRKRTKYFKERESAKNEQLDSNAEDQLFVMEQLYGGDVMTEGDNDDFVDDGEMYGQTEHPEDPDPDRIESQQIQ